MFEQKITDDVHEFLKNHIETGMCVCDLTVGNGYDTLFLAGLVGSTGQVIGFDIQEVAISKLRNQLQDKGWHHVELICDDHSRIDAYHVGPFHIGMMNLGYLPTGDKRIVTRYETTLKAIEGFLGKLLSGGILSIVAYKGHDDGEEYMALNHYLKTLDSKTYQVRCIGYVNRTEHAPDIFLIRKK